MADFFGKFLRFFLVTILGALNRFWCCLQTPVVSLRTVFIYFLFFFFFSFFAGSS